MACCTGQTECNHIVTIGYLRGRIQNYIQDSNGNVVSISSSYTDDTYCPTYTELTGGSVIQTSSIAAHPKDDRDGISIAATCSDSGLAYTSEQEVNQLDLMINYTRFNTSSISASPTGISACGGNSALSYQNTYGRHYTKLRDFYCDGPDTISSSVTTTSNDTIAFSISSSPNYGSISNATYTIGKNVEPSGASRSDTVSAATTFRGTNYGSSNTVVITQSALTGSYATQVSTYKVTTGLTTGDTTTTAFTGCGTSGYTAVFTRQYDVWEIRKWVDECGKDYPDLTTSSKTSDSGSETVTSITKNWDAVACPIESKVDNDTISYTYTDTNYGVVQTEWTNSVNFTRTCSQTCCSQVGYWFSDCPRNVSNMSDCSGNGAFTLTAETACLNPPGERTPYTNFSIDWDFVSGDDFVTFNNGAYTWADNCTNVARSATYKLTMKSKDDPSYMKECNITFSQLAGPCPHCDCGCDALNIEQGVPEVDLGLPSGTKWSKFNVGAVSEAEYGNYYEYGSGALTYQQTSGTPEYEGTENPLAASADTATQVFGSPWHMPTKTQFEELIANTTLTWETIDGIGGLKFTAQNGNYVFFPAAGNYPYLTNLGTEIRMWCSTHESGDAWHANFLVGVGADPSNPPTASVGSIYGRVNGFSIRGVIG